MYIYYNPQTLQIMGGSIGSISMDFPYVWSDQIYNSFENLAIDIVDGVPTLIVVQG